MDEAKRKAILDAVVAAKRSTYGVTAIKMELEAQLNRDDSGGNRECPDCSGMGYDDNDDTCLTCDGDGEVNVSRESVPWCQQFMLEKMEEIGLAERVSGELVVKHPLVFAKFYRDGSVDSEFTFTIALDDPENIFLITKVIDAFNALAAEIGHGIEIDGAGMHTSLLRRSDCMYGPNYYAREATTSFNNYKRAMMLLIPAMFFLGTPNGETRQLHFRVPGVSDNEKYTAIALRYGVLEFRLFDTCYDDPDRALDNFVVMSNTLKFWKPRYVNPRVDEVLKGKPLYFGTRDGSDRHLTRLYTTVEHINVLKKGLEILKPRYYSIEDLYAQREFNLDTDKLNEQMVDFTQQIDREYEEYLDRRRIMREQRSNTILQFFTDRGESPTDIARRIEREMVFWDTDLLTKRTFVRQRTDELMREQHSGVCLT